MTLADTDKIDVADDVHRMQRLAKHGKLPYKAFWRE